MQFMDLLARDPNREDILTRLAVGLIGYTATYDCMRIRAHKRNACVRSCLFVCLSVCSDICTIIQQPAKPTLGIHAIGTIINAAINSRNDRTKECGKWAAGVSFVC